jgi:hypothetical protein
MNTTLSHQITSVQYARTLVEKQISKSDPDELSRISAGLNDAGATLAALKMAKGAFENLSPLATYEQKRDLAFEFFQTLASL